MANANENQNQNPIIIKPKTHERTQTYTGRGIPFAKGNKLSPGFAYHKYINDFRQSIYACTSREEMITQCQKLKALALDDDPTIALKAIDMFWKYAGIKPPEKLEIQNQNTTFDPQERIKAFKEALSIKE